MNTAVKTDAWFCSRCWDRHEIPAGGDQRKRKPCPDCGEKLHRVSRYEWFLEDAISAALEAAGADFKIRPQFPIEDHRGFTWYWDIGIWVKGSSAFDGYGLLIDVNGRDHLLQKTYSGAGGGYTRDYDKVWELGQQQWHKRGWDHWIVPNDLCRRAGNIVYTTAQEIVTPLAHPGENPMLTIPVRTTWDKQPNRDRQHVLGHSSDRLFCLSHLYIGDKDRQAVRPSPLNQCEPRTRTLA